MRKRIAEPVDPKRGTSKREIAVCRYMYWSRSPTHFLTIYRYENCWTAFADGMKGVIFIMNPDDVDQEEQLDKWLVYILLD